MQIIELYICILSFGIMQQTASFGSRCRWCRLPWATLIEVYLVELQHTLSDGIDEYLELVVLVLLVDCWLLVLPSWRSGWFGQVVCAHRESVRCDGAWTGAL